MNTINSENCLLLIIDIQEKLVNMLKDDEVKKNSIILAKTADILNIETIITEQYPKGLGSTIEEIRNTFSNTDYVEKTAFSAYAEIIEKIKASKKKQIILFGIETHICVLQTAFDLLNDKYEVFVVTNACGSRNEEDKLSAFSRLRHAGAQTVTTEMVVFELLKSSKNPKFKEIQNLIK